MLSAKIVNNFQKTGNCRIQILAIRCVFQTLFTLQTLKLNNISLIKIIDLAKTAFKILIFDFTQNYCKNSYGKTIVLIKCDSALFHY